MFRLLTLVAFVFSLSSSAAEENPKSVYSVSLGTDLAISAVALTTSLVPYAFAGSWIQRRCPCPVSEIPSFDRGGMNNHSSVARIFSDALVGLALVGPVAAALSATAVTVSLRYDQNVWPWLVAAGATATVAALRVLGGNHFISDTVVGAAVGTSVGILVPLLHKRNVNSTQAFSLAPISGGLSAYFSWRL